jgi:hypothetical protein
LGSSKKIIGADGRLRGGSSTLPVFCSIADWAAISGLSRSCIYELLASGDLRGRKRGKQVLIDVAHGLRFIESLPLVEIKPPRAKSAKTTEALANA